MQIKVFKAGNMKDAMAAMKAELGDEAVILHSKKYKEGGLLGIGSREVVEITAAVEENSMPRRIETPRLTHPTVKPNSLLTRYKTDGTAQGVANAEQAAEYETPRPTLFNGSQSRSMQIDGLADRVAAQKNRQSDSQRNFDDMLESAKENNFAVDLNANNPETVPAYNQPVEKISSVETPPPAQENISDVETPPPAQENISNVETPPPAQENISNVETPPIAEENIPNVETPTPAQENISNVETPPPAQENISDVETPPPAQENISSVETPPPAQEKSQSADTPPQPALFTQEQMAQTQAMIMAQFNQMQMMQQAAIAQAQAQAAEQIRIQQETAQAQQAALAQQTAIAQQAAIVQQTPPQPDPQSEEKIKRLEEEIAQMKALLAEVLGRETKKGTISLHEAMKQQEVDEEILTEMATQANAGETLVDIHTPVAKATLTNYLNEHVKFSDGVKLNRHGVRIVALLGTTGVGKTTTLAKIAAKFVLEQRTNVALVTADTYRISAVEQLKTYSDILELPLEIVYNPAELASSIERHRDKELILIDTAGRSQHNEYQMRELEEFLRVNPRIEKHLVISATTKLTDARQIMNKFSQVEPDKIIFTKIDETGTLGMIINLLRDSKYSLSYITTGQSVPDDIERASADVLTNLLLKKVEEQ